MAWRREFVLLTVSVAITAGMLEAGLRVADISYPIVHQMEPLRGWAPLPGVTGVMLSEGEAHIAMNGEGFRDRNHEAAKPAGTYRIAVLGDSMTEALGVEVSDTFWSILERNLSSCDRFSGRTVEVMNFSVTGYGPAQERVTLRHNALKYAPDLVLLALYTGNDILNSDRALDGHKDRVYYTLDGKGGLVLDDSNTQADRFETKRFWRRISNGLVNASNLLQVIREGTTRIRNLFRPAAKEGAVFAATGREYEVFREPRTPDWRNGWAVTEALTAAMRDDSRAAGADFLLAVLPGPVQVYPDIAVRQKMADAMGVTDLSYADRRLRDFAQRKEIPAIILAEPLQEYVARTGTYLHGFPNTRPGIGHWNAEGHRAAGDILATAICRGVP